MVLYLVPDGKKVYLTNVNLEIESDGGNDVIVNCVYADGHEMTITRTYIEDEIDGFTGNPLSVYKQVNVVLPFPVLLLPGDGIDAVAATPGSVEIYVLGYITDI